MGGGSRWHQHASSSLVVCLQPWWWGLKRNQLWIMSLKLAKNIWALGMCGCPIFSTLLRDLWVPWWSLDGMGCSWKPGLWGIMIKNDPLALIIGAIHHQEKHCWLVFDMYFSQLFCTGLLKISWKDNNLTAEWGSVIHNLPTTLIDTC